MRLVQSLTIVVLVGIVFASAAGIVPELLSDPSRVVGETYHSLTPLLMPSLVTAATILGALLAFWRPISSRLTHRPGLILGISSFVLIIGATSITTWVTDHLHYEHLVDRLAADTLVATVGVLALGLAGGIIGVLGFAQALLRPHFRASLLFLNDDGSVAKSLRLEEEPSRATGDGLIPLKPAKVRVLITNDGQMDAAYVYVVVDFADLAFSGDADHNQEKYSFITHSDPASPGAKMQWESGADTVVHRDQSASVNFSLNNVWAHRSVAISVSLVIFAEGATPLRRSYIVLIDRVEALALESARASAVPANVGGQRES